MITEFLRWWLQQLLDLLAWNGRGARFSRALIVEAAGETLLLRQLRPRQNLALGQVRVDDHALEGLRSLLRGRPRARHVVLRLPASLLLEHQVSLPLLAEREPERVLRYEMDRLTPFAADEVFWGFAITGRDRARGRLQLRLSLVAREAVQGLLALLGQAGAAPTVLELGERQIALDHTGPRRQRHLLGVAIAATAALGLAALVLPFVLQSLALGRVQASISALQPAVARAEALRRQVAGRQAGSNVVAAERVRVGDALGALAAVTAILPDDTFLNAFALEQRKLTLSGQSATAARLIAALSSDPAISNPTFAAPVTRTADGRAELFAIHAELAP